MHGRPIYTAVLFWAIAATGASAQYRPLTRMGGWIMTAWAGGAANSALQRSGAEVQWLSPTGQPEEHAFARRLSAQTSPVFGGDVAYWFNQKWGVRVQGGYAPSRLGITVRDRDAANLPSESTLTGSDRFRSLHVWSLDGQLLWRVPLTPRGRVAPYTFLGAGALRYDAAGSEPLPPEAESAFAGQETHTKAAAVVGLGLLVPIPRHDLAFDFELSNHLARTPVPEAGSTQIEDGTVTMRTASATAAPSASTVRLTNHVRLQVGMSWLQRARKR